MLIQVIGLRIGQTRAGIFGNDGALLDCRCRINSIPMDLGSPDYKGHIGRLAFGSEDKKSLKVRRLPRWFSKPKKCFSAVSSDPLCDFCSKLLVRNDYSSHRLRIAYQQL